MRVLLGFVFLPLILFPVAAWAVVDFSCPEGTTMHQSEGGDGEDFCEDSETGELEGPFRVLEGGAVVEEGQYEDGQMTGQWTAYDAKGEEVRQGAYKEGQPHGEWKQWYEDGQLLQKGSYEMGKEEGVWTTWYPNGQKSEERRFEDGGSVGKWTTWFSNGQKSEEGEYNNLGDLEGRWVVWQQNGQRISEIHYQDGVNHGLERLWHPNGEKMLEANWSEGMLEGELKEWYPDGTKQRTLSYEKDLREGAFKEWYWGGQLKEEGRYRADLPVGVVKSWHPNGQLALESPYEDGELHGEVESWYEDGVRQSRVQWEAGVRHGRFEAWTASGANQERGRYFYGMKQGVWVLGDGREESMAFYAFDYELDQPFECEAGLTLAGDHLPYVETISGSSMSLPQPTSPESGGYRVSCVDERSRQQGWSRVYVSNKVLQWEGAFVDGLKEGQWTRYQDGQVVETQEYHQGRLEGEFQLFEDGELRFRCPYLNSKAHGIARAYSAEEVLWMEYAFVDGLLEGESWDGRSGQVERYSWENGRKSGPSSKFYPGGELEFEGAFREGKPEGEWRYYHENGELDQVGRVENGVREGRWRVFSERGELLEEGDYVAGKRHGIWEVTRGGELVEVEFSHGREFHRPYDDDHLYALGNLDLRYLMFEDNEEVVDSPGVLSGNLTARYLYGSPGVSILLDSKLGASLEGGFAYRFQLGVGGGVGAPDQGTLSATAGLGVDGVTSMLPLAMTLPVELVSTYRVSDSFALGGWWRETFMFFAGEREEGSSLALLGDELEAGITFSFSRSRHSEAYGFSVQYGEQLGIWSLTLGVGLVGVL